MSGVPSASNSVINATPTPWNRGSELGNLNSFFSVDRPESPGRTPGRLAERAQRGGAHSQLSLVDQQIESAGGGVEHDFIAIADESDGTTHGSLRRDV